MRTTTLLALLTLSCCETTTFTVPPPRAERIQPKEEWRDLWRDVEQCSGLSGNFDRARWFRVLEEMRDTADVSEAGMWYYPHDLYLIPEIVDNTENSWSEVYKKFYIMHVILHDLKQTDKHPKEFDMCNLQYKP